MRVPGVDVHEAAVVLDLAVEERDEARRQPRLVDDAVQALDRAHDLEVALDRHAQARVDVAHLEGRRQAVARGVGDRDAEDAVGDRDEVEVVAARRAPPGVVNPAISSEPRRSARLGRIDIWMRRASCSAET